MTFSEQDRKRVSDIRQQKREVLAELYTVSLPIVEQFIANHENAKAHLQNALIKLREDIAHDRLDTAGHRTLPEYLGHLCKEGHNKEVRDRELDRKIFDSLNANEPEGWAFYYMQIHYFPGVKFFVLQHGGSEEEAKDVIMDGIEALIRNIQDGSYQFKDSAKLKTYFFQICRNKWFDHANRKKRAKPFSLLSDLESDTFDQGFYYELNEDLLNDRQRIVAELFVKSTDTCRQVLSFFYYDELSHEDIAERMGFSGAESSKTQKNKCLRKLKSAIKTILHPAEVRDFQAN